MAGDVSVIEYGCEVRRKEDYVGHKGSKTSIRLKLLFA